ncbi:MAG: hypothetical protein M3443_06535 [Actinomycetota bacterium]|nr:hypothetical protein [Actinomycetota bacterium]
MTLHTFVDESRRNGTYLLAAALIRPTQLHPIRTLMRGLRMPGARHIHFKHERDSVQKDIAAALVDTPVLGRIYVGRGKPETVRRSALHTMTLDLHELGLSRLVLDSRGAVADRSDRHIISATMQRAIGTVPFTYEHLRSHEEPALRVPDVIACAGARVVNGVGGSSRCSMRCTT